MIKRHANAHVLAYLSLVFVAHLEREPPATLGSPGARDGNKGPVIHPVLQEGPIVTPTGSSRHAWDVVGPCRAGRSKSTCPEGQT